MASVSGAPDYMLTIWNWRHEWVMLRCKAFSQDVGHVSFSTEVAGLLTTAGTGHIRLVIGLFLKIVVLARNAFCLDIWCLRATRLHRCLELFEVTVLKQARRRNTRD